MDNINFSRTITKTINCDVAVLGAGPAGFMAAIAAARGGAKTVLIEKNSFIGGMATAGLVAPISVFCYNNELVVGGLPWEFINRLVDAQGAQIEYPLGNISFCPETYKLIAQRMCKEAGVSVYYNTSFIDCEKEAEMISRVIIHNKEGLSTINANIYIDSTGDADLAACANVPMLKYDSPLQPCSTYFCIANVDIDQVDKIHHSEQGVNYHMESYRDILLKHMDADGLPEFGGPWMCYMMNNNSLLVNITRRSANTLDPVAATETADLLREDMFKLAAAFKKYIPAFKDSYIAFSSPIVGVRETRHIKGIHVLTGDECLRGEYFPDTISRSAHPIDIHASEGNTQRCEFLKTPIYIPYRSLIAKGFPNLIVACRAFSADREAFASCRVQAPIMGIGAAAGTAAELCVSNGCSVDDVDINALRDKLIKSGANI